MSNINPDHKYWMNRAIYLARHAQYEGEVPIGAVLVCDNNIIGEGWNCSIKQHDPTAHAEIIALRNGAFSLKNYRLPNTTILYVTLEPCMMCLGAIIHSRINTLVYGASNKKNEIMELFNYFSVNHKINIISGILKLDCSTLLNNFFYFHRLQSNKKNNL